MKKYQILGESIEQTAVWHPIIKKFAKGTGKKPTILMNFNGENG